MTATTMARRLAAVSTISLLAVLILVLRTSTAMAASAFIAPGTPAVSATGSGAATAKATATALPLFESAASTSRRKRRQGPPSRGEGEEAGGGATIAGSRRRATEEDVGAMVREAFAPGVPPAFPHVVRLATTTTTTTAAPAPSAPPLPTELIVRHLEEEDVAVFLPEMVREFGALIKSTAPALGGASGDPLQRWGDEMEAYLENYLFSFTVLAGLTQRVRRRKAGYTDRDGGEAGKNDDGSRRRPWDRYPTAPDHNVVCLVERCADDSGSEEIVGIAELSLQPLDPNRNAPPFVLPTFVKSALCRLPVWRRGRATRVGGYVSNVLVARDRRGLGYGRVLVAACEGIAKCWRCEDVSLHVDANVVSGQIAQRLYYKMGYVGVSDEGGGDFGKG